MSVTTTKPGAVAARSLEDWAEVFGESPEFLERVLKAAGVPSMRWGFSKIITAADLFDVLQRARKPRTRRINRGRRL